MISREPYRLLLPSATVIGPLLATAWNAIQLGRRRIYPEADSSGSLFDLMLTSLSASISRLPLPVYYLPCHLSPSFLLTSIRVPPPFPSSFTCLTAHPSSTLPPFHRVFARVRVLLLSIEPPLASLFFLPL